MKKIKQSVIVSMVNTFLIGDFHYTAKTLDPQRRFKQVVEAHQIINLITNNSKGSFSNHPAVKMWKNNLDALKLYYNIILNYCLNNTTINITKLKYHKTPLLINMPWFVTFKPLIYSHRARLFQKNPHYYSQLEFPTEYLKVGYCWIREPLNSQHYIKNSDNLTLLCDKLDNIYVTPKYCQAVYRSGKNKNKVCNILLRNTSSMYCQRHKNTPKIKQLNC